MHKQFYGDRPRGTPPSGELSFRWVPKSVTLNDLERRNGPYFVSFHRIRGHCHRKTIIRPKPPFQNLLLIVYDHINVICAIIQRVFGQNEEAIASISDCSCLRPCLLMSFLYQWAGPYCPVQQVGWASPL